MSDIEDGLFNNSDDDNDSDAESVAESEVDFTNDKQSAVKTASKLNIGKVITDGVLDDDVEDDEVYGDGDVDVAAHQLAQCRQPFRHQIMVRREVIVGQRFPVRQHVHTELRREEGNLLQQALCLPCRLRQHQQRTSAGRQFGQQGGVAGTVEQGGAGALPGCGQLFWVHQVLLLKRALL